MLLVESEIEGCFHVAEIEARPEVREAMSVWLPKMQLLRERILSRIKTNFETDDPRLATKGLTTEERRELSNHEGIIEKGYKGMITVIDAVKLLRRNRAGLQHG